MNQHARDAVTRGATLLDQFFTYNGETEDWAVYIDREALNIAFPWACVLGQLAPMMSSAAQEVPSEALFSDAWNALKLNLSIADPEDDFFTAHDDDVELLERARQSWYGFDDSEHFGPEELDEAWLNELMEREHAGTSQD